MLKEHLFKDYYNNNVRFSTKDHPYSKEPRHVWVIARYKNSWLLTIHPSRGLEFPGGKVEKGETACEAAKREVFEETGGHVTITNLHYIGQYQVEGKSETVIKNVYYAEIKELISKKNYFETKGPKLVKHLPDNVKENKQYSFIMKDNVLSLSLSEVERRFFTAKHNS
ncbi:nucleoside triphosphatase YtkD [Salipaludibacillus agaradhaerens]|jgi:8-oxo-dGTP diphosphatase|uniref:Nucleoside triphosphatase YtkD n=1 Tax=Salipaludibacillus agaradhaerens TaxID=76935 RepID=A0A9Q4FXT1_SALAG|nr:nucleoside triphosphatase YtkD [Salipaludibacillus agaradhaerens]MCR6095402.1 nucleoside triphosphatase YtkD [Salipaludibacillus agaradhaerens]MCR6115040.1 nucleoside triphosphatase YtkD [Salipaludibacillus agaradhaerens]